jgi:hypothetical protein
MRRAPLTLRLPDAGITLAKRGGGMTAFTICIPIVPEFDMMDVANPYEIFCWMRPFWRAPDLELNVLLVGHEARTTVKSFKWRRAQDARRV